MPLAYTHDTPLLNLSVLLSYPHVCIQCPDDPDADSLAAGFGLYSFFVINGKRPEWMYCGKRSISRPNLLEMLQAFSLPIRHEPTPGRIHGLVITVGCQYGASSLTAIDAEAVAVFDCAQPENKTEILGDIRPYLTSCSTLVYLLLCKADFQIEQSLGAALRFGLYSASKGFSEIRFPLDRDMRDAIAFNERLFTRFVRSNLCLAELSLTARALNTLELHTENGTAVINVLPCEPDLLRFIADLALNVHGIDLALVFSENAQGVTFSIRSAHRDMQAGRTAAYVTSNRLGVGGGAEKKGGGSIRAAHYERCYGDMSFTTFFRERIQAYGSEYEVFDCTEGRAPHPGTLYAYQKLPIEQAFVVCSGLFPKRTRLLVRMLEGDITITVSLQTYLMIGMEGEVYPIEKQAFSELYLESGALPELLLEYSPAVIDCNEGTRTELLPHARGCITREKRILARQLTKGVKIFTRWDTDTYVQGEPGDWLVQRRSDKSDLYVIKQHIFPQLYSRVPRP